MLVVLMAMTMVVVTMEVMTMIIVMVVVIMTKGSDGIKTPRQRRVIAPSRNTLVVTTMKVMTEVQVVDKVQCTCNGADYENGHDGADDNCDGKHSPCCHIQHKAWLQVIIRNRRC